MGRPSGPSHLRGKAAPDADWRWGWGCCSPCPWARPPSSGWRTPGLTPGLGTGIPGLSFPSETLGRIVLQGVSFGLILVIFLLLYKLLPNTKTYWQYIWPGALVGAALFELLKNLFLIYVNSFSNFENVYGSLAPVIALLLWAYVSSFILILGAELSSEYGLLKSNTQRGTLIDPDAARR